MWTGGRDHEKHTEAECTVVGSPAGSYWVGQFSPAVTSLADVVMSGDVKGLVGPNTLALLHSCTLRDMIAHALRPLSLIRRVLTYLHALPAGVDCNAYAAEARNGRHRGAVRFPPMGCVCGFVLSTASRSFYSRTGPNLWETYAATK